MSLRSELEENPLEPPINEEYFEYRDRFDSEEDFVEAVKVWPRCPQCGRRRITRCPVCKNVGDLFPLGDVNFWDPTPQTDSGCACSHCGTCRDQKLVYDETESPSTLEGELIPGVPTSRRREFLSGKTSDAFDDLPDERERATAWGEDDPELQQPVICPSCSEAFAPVFQRCCENCGYDFGDGEIFDAPSDGETDADVDDFIARKNAEEDVVYQPNVGRATLTIVALALFGLGVFIYLTYILR